MKTRILLLCFLGVLGTSFAQTYPTYRIRPNADTTQCLRITNNGVNNGDGFSVATCDTSSTFNQFQEIPGPQDSAGCISPVLAAVPGTAPNGAATNLVTQVTFDPSNRAHYWVKTLPPAGNSQPTANYFWFKNLADGKCMTTEWLANYIDTYACSNGADSQFWTIATPDSTRGGIWKLKTQAALNALNPCLKVNGGNPGSGVATSMTGCTDGEFQQAYMPFTQTPKLYKSVGSGKCIDGGSAAGTSYQWDCSPTAYNHNWLLFNYPSDGTNSYWHFMDIASGMCLSYDPNSTAVNNVVTQPCDPNNLNQQWKKIF